MKCRKIRKLLLKDQEALSQDQKKEITLHLKTCEKCRTISQSLYNLEKSIQQSKNENVPSYLTESLWEKVRNRITNISQRGKREIRKTRSHLRPVLIWGIPSFGMVCLLLWLTLTQPWKSLSKNDNFNSSVDIVIESAQIDRKDAQIAVFETKNPDMTFIWLDKQKTED